MSPWSSELVSKTKQLPSPQRENRSTNTLPFPRGSVGFPVVSRASTHGEGNDRCISKSRTVLPLHTLKTLYNSLFLPCITHVTLIRESSYSSFLEPVCRLQKKVIHIITSSIARNRGHLEPANYFQRYIVLRLGTKKIQYGDYHGSICEEAPRLLHLHLTLGIILA